MKEKSFTKEEARAFLQEVVATGKLSDRRVLGAAIRAVPGEWKLIAKAVRG